MDVERTLEIPLISNGYRLSTTPERQGWLTPSDPGQPVKQLWEQFHQQGYLWLRGLLDRADVLDFRRRYFAAFARSGLVAAFILGMGRAVGETMAVIMVAGNTLEIPHSLTDPVRTLTSNIALEMGYASGQHRQALFATGVVLFVIIMILNTIALAVSHRKAGKAGRR